MSKMLVSIICGSVAGLNFGAALAGSPIPQFHFAMVGALIPCIVITMVQHLQGKQ